MFYLVRVNNPNSFILIELISLQLIIIIIIILIIIIIGDIPSPHVKLFFPRGAILKQKQFITVISPQSCLKKPKKPIVFSKQGKHVTLSVHAVVLMLYSQMHRQDSLSKTASLTWEQYNFTLLTRKKQQNEFYSKKSY